MVTIHYRTEGGVRVFLPYLQIEPATIESLRGRDFHALYTGPVSDDRAYARYFRDRWREGESFVTIEHDGVFPWRAVDELIACDSPLCFFQHANGLSDVLYLGLAKITAPVIAATAPLWETADENALPRWIVCANWIDGAAKAAGFRPHCHTPPIVNLFSDASPEH